MCILQQLLHNRAKMANKWFIVSKIKMRETMYASWLASEITSAKSVIYEDGNDDLAEAVNERRLERDIRYEFITPADFFAAELAEMRLSGNDDFLRIRYDKKSQCLEFISEFTSDSIFPVIDHCLVISSTANFKENSEKDICVVSTDTIDNIVSMIEIGSDTIRIISSNDNVDSMPSDLKDFYMYIFNEILPKTSANEHLDTEIISKFTSIIDRILAKGIEHTVQTATAENPNILTNDAVYFTDGTNVYHVKGYAMPEADPYTFVSCGNDYAKDANHVYYGKDIIEGALPSSFTALAWEYAKDATRSYYKGLPLSAGKNFRALRPAYGYASDGNTVYYCGTPIKDSDPTSFYAVGEGKEHGGIYFGADSNGVYLDGLKIDYIHAKTFEHIDGYFFKDKSYVYWGKDIIDGCVPSGVKVLNNHYIADPYNVFFVYNGAVTVLAEANVTKIRVNGLFAADDKHVYYKGDIIENADGATANIKDGSSDGYITDACSVFYCSTKLPASSKTFISLGFGYGKDDMSVFFKDKLVQNADTASFRPISYGSATDKYAKYNLEKQYSKKYIKNLVRIVGNYFKDGSQVYYHNNIIEAAHAETFSPVAVEDSESTYNDNIDFNGEEYAKDCRNVYYMGNPIVGAIPESFVLFGAETSSEHPEERGFYGKDSLNVYFKGEQIIGADPATFCSHKIKNVWQDKNFLYLNGEMIPYVDAASFKHIEYSFYCDQNGIYYEIEPINGISPENAVVLGSRYINDGNLFCYVEKSGDDFIINTFNAHTNSFDIVESEPSFSFDKDGMFFKGDKLHHISTETAELLGGQYIKDGNRIFCGNYEIEGTSPDTFMFLGDGYAFDGSNAYYNGLLLDTKKVLHPLGNGYATDGYLFWRWGKLISDPENDSYILDTLGNIF